MCLLGFSFCFFPPLLQAGSQVQEIPGVDTLDSESLIELAHSNPDLVVIDSRNPEDRYLGYIEDSVNLPDKQTSCKSLFQVTRNKTQTLVFYCNGIKCNRSVNSIRIAQQCDYQNIYWFKGGFEEWRLKDYPYLLE